MAVRRMGSLGAGARPHPEGGAHHRRPRVGRAVSAPNIWPRPYSIGAWIGITGIDESRGMPAAARHGRAPRFIIAAIANNPAASQAKRSDTSGRSIARSEPRSHREARSEARNSTTIHPSRARAVGNLARSTSTRRTTCERDANGRIKRNPAARRAFQSSHPCPANAGTSGACPGYVADHIVPLKRGGADEPPTCSGRRRRKQEQRTESNDAHHSIRTGPVLISVVALCYLSSGNSPQPALTAIQPHRTIHLVRTGNQVQPPAMEYWSEPSLGPEDQPEFSTLPEPGPSWPYGGGCR